MTPILDPYLLSDPYLPLSVEYLGLRRFDENEIPEISKFVFDEACRLEQSAALLGGIGRYLRDGLIFAKDGRLTEPPLKVTRL